MDFEVVAVGTELLLGFTIDSNSADIGQALAPIGARVVRRATVGDDPAGIRAAVAEALGRTGRVITTGGLGPTIDDVTKKCVAEIFGVPLEFDDQVWDSLVERYARLMRRQAARNRCQAEVPRGASVLPNRWGSAPGLWLEGEPGLVIMLPGVPLELRNLMRHEVAPRISRSGSGAAIVSRTLRTTGIAESSLAERLTGVERNIDPVTLAYLPGTAGVDLRLTCWNEAPDRARELLDAAAGRIRHLIGIHCFGEGDCSLGEAVLERARHRGLTIAVAESCTGGLVAKQLTDVPGSSMVFRGGVVAYHDDIKRSLLDVPAEELEKQGAVSEEVARDMARGAAIRLGADLALSITGIAGPGGATENKPIGTVWHGYLADGTIDCEHRIYPGTREEVRLRSAAAALFGLLKRIDGGAEG